MWPGDTEPYEDGHYRLEEPTNNPPALA